jgi:uncharacterized membrane protein YkvA (DUF1232 family)
MEKKAKQLNNEVHALYLASKDPRTPWYAKVFAALIIGYALSPIDLIPDFIPVLGYLDDLIIIPVGIVLFLKMIPKEVMEECREKARSQSGNKNPKNWIAGVIMVLIWLLTIYGVVRIIW